MLATSEAEAESIVLRFAPVVRIKARALGFLPGSIEWDDVCSDGLLALWLAVASWDPARGALSARVAFRVWAAMVDGLRHRGVGRHPDPIPLSLLGDDEGAASGSLEDLVIALDLAARTRTVDARLPEIVAMREQGYSAAEVGAHLGVTAARIRQLIGEARRAVAA